jgi:hypothetical protein
MLLAKTPGFSDVARSFTLDIVRLQQDSHRVALAASLTHGAREF